MSKKITNKLGKRKKTHKFRNFILGLLIIAAAVGVLGYTLLGSFYKQMNYVELESTAKEPLKEEGVTNILLIGNDSRDNDQSGRSDAMILLSISSATKTVHITSLLRDMYVEIPGHDSNRLNAAYSYGGAELLMETIEANFDIEVNRYMQVNFEAFANLVDAVGGVDLELTKEEVHWINAYLWEYNILLERPEGTDYFEEGLEGMLHLNGAQALSYCRNRAIGNDFGRTERQRKVLGAMIDNAPKAILNLDQVAEGVFGNVTTNLTKSECMQLAAQAGAVFTHDIVQGRIPMDGTYSNTKIRGMDVLKVDFEANNAFIRSEIYGK